MAVGYDTSKVKLPDFGNLFSSKTYNCLCIFYEYQEPHFAA